MAMLYAIGFNMNEFHKKFKYSCELNMEKVNSFRNDYSVAFDLLYHN